MAEILTDNWHLYTPIYQPREGVLLCNVVTSSQKLNKRKTGSIYGKQDVYIKRGNVIIKLQMKNENSCPDRVSQLPSPSGVR